MSRLLGVGIRRYTRSVIFWLGIAATIIIAIINGLDAKDCYLDDWCIVMQYFANTIVITWLIGREGSEGIFRNKIIVGHTKATIYMSEFILAIAATTIMFLIHAIIFGIFNSYASIAMDAELKIKMFLIFMLINMAICSIIVMFSCLISRFVIVAVFNVMFILGIYYCAYAFEPCIDEEPYIYEAEYEIEVFENEAGGESIIRHEIEGTGKYVPNPFYIGGWRQTACEIIYNIVPTCQMNTYVDFMEYFGYDSFSSENKGITYEQNFDEPRSLTAEEDKEISIDVICSILVIVVTTTGGMLIFRKKRFK